MALVKKIDSNVTGLWYAEEATIGLLPSETTTDNAGIWYPLEPNSYSELGGEVTTVARAPINPSRQLKKGVATDLEAGGAFNTDITQENLQDLLQGTMFADVRRKGEEVPTSSTTGPNKYLMASTTGIQVGDLIFVKGFLTAANNGLKRITAISVDTDVTVAETLANETPPAGATLVVVGHQAAATDIDVDATGTWPALTSTALDFTTLGLIVGEPIWVGGDGALEDFVNVENNGYKRIKTIAATRLEFDKSTVAMSDETGTSLTIRLFIGRVLKNELGALIKRRSYNLERTLGAPDDALPAQVQAEYLEGAMQNQFTINIPTAGKATVDIAFVGLDNTQKIGSVTNKSDHAAATKKTLVEADAFNTSSDVSRIKLAQFTIGSEAPTALFAFVEELTLVINNNLTVNKAISVFGGFDVTAGVFQVTGSMTAYFSDIAAVLAVRNNEDITLDFLMVKANAGIAVDIPLIALGDGRLNVEKDVAIKLPLSMDAATAAKIDSATDHTLMIVHFDYLPNAADL